MDFKHRHAVGAFTLVEILIVVAIVGILAAIAIPLLADQSQKAKETAAKQNLKILRDAIERYAAQHGGTPPGFLNGDMSKTPLSTTFTQQLCSASNNLGPYLLAIPKNPFNGKNTIKVIASTATLSASATGSFGWIYKPLTKTIKIDYPDTDSENVRYYDY
ncbi:MAG: type II secretion system protein [Phycisphaerae bacterium]|jgi:type II secretory pathway pseudopilin PulG